MSRTYQLESPRLFVAHKRSDRATKDLNVRHCHSTYEILYVVGGSGRYLVEGDGCDMRANTLLLIPPLEYHCVEVTETEPYERFVINFDPQVLSSGAAALLDRFSPDARGNFFPSESLGPQIAATFDRLSVALTLPEEQRLAFSSLVLAELVYLLSGAKAAPVLAQENVLGARVIRYLNDHFTENISLDELARRFFVSKYYLCRAFKAHNGISVHGYIKQKRVTYAKQLIELGETASGAAYRVGFGDYSAFYRAYQKIVGSSPVSGQTKRSESADGEEKSI